MSRDSENRFETAFAIVVGHEGGFTNNAADPGNWTGGRCGVGELRGTKFGISAAAYPTVDIANLELLDAQSIYRRDYWNRLQADALPPDVALAAFDTAVNCGLSRTARWLQSIAGVPEDGMIGPRTLSAIAANAGHRDGGAGICAELQARRLIFLTTLPTWETFGLGWARRICHLCMVAPGLT